MSPWTPDDAVRLRTFLSQTPDFIPRLKSFMSKAKEEQVKVETPAAPRTEGTAEQALDEFMAARK